MIKNLAPTEKAVKVYKRDILTPLVNYIPSYFIGFIKVGRLCRQTLKFCAESSSRKVAINKRV